MKYYLNIYLYILERSPLPHLKACLNTYYTRKANQPNQKYYSSHINLCEKRNQIHREANR